MNDTGLAFLQALFLKSKTVVLHKKKTGTHKSKKYSCR